jgi:hypothetical protein
MLCLLCAQGMISAKSFQSLLLSSNADPMQLETYLQDVHRFATGWGAFFLFLLSWCSSEVGLHLLLMTALCTHSACAVRPEPSVFL